MSKLWRHGQTCCTLLSLGLCMVVLQHVSWYVYFCALSLGWLYCADCWQSFFCCSDADQSHMLHALCVLALTCVWADRLVNAHSFKTFCHIVTLSMPLCIAASHNVLVVATKCQHTRFALHSVIQCYCHSRLSWCLIRWPYMPLFTHTWCIRTRLERFHFSVWWECVWACSCVFISDSPKSVSW